MCKILCSAKRTLLKASELLKQNNLLQYIKEKKTGNYKTAPFKYLNKLPSAH